ncbi:MAG: hypothetical protein M3169_16110, partial [Candidatus Eremiobacteraeota bacterium]|nr:hypothetical protein [Candidatus Eremiobacteraeota bacterium]
MHAHSFDRARPGPARRSAQVITMQAKRLVLAAVLALAVTGACGCASHRVRTEISGGYDSPAPHRHAPAPADPDLGTVMERFYQQVEGAHWR